MGRWGGGGGGGGGGGEAHGSNVKSSSEAIRSNQKQSEAHGLKVKSSSSTSAPAMSTWKISSHRSVYVPRPPSSKWKTPKSCESEEGEDCE